MATQLALEDIRHAYARNLRRTLPFLLALLVLPADAAARGGPASTARPYPQTQPGGFGEVFAQAPSPAAAAGALQGSTATTTSCTPAWGTYHVGNWPPACWRPYGTKSPFNFALPASPRISSESTAIIKYMVGHGWSFDPNEAGDFTWKANGTRPVYWSTSTDPLISVTCQSANCTSGMRLRIPAGATPEEQIDGHMTVVDQEHGREYDFYQASKPQNGQMTTTAGKSIPIGNELGTGLEGDAEAADLGLLGGLVRAAELSAGKIEHALVTTVKCVQLHDVWPSPATATGDAICPFERIGPRFASLLQLNMSDAEIAATGAPSWQQAIMKAMAQYGVYVVDTEKSRSMNLLSEDELSYTSFGYQGRMGEFIRVHGGTNGVLVGIPIQTSKLRVIDPCVAERKC